MEEKRLVVVAEVEVERVMESKICAPVQVFVLPRFIPIVLAVLPLYVPEKVRVESVADKLAKETSPTPTVAQVATPKAERTRANWLVQVVPVYLDKVPFAFVKRSAEAREETAKLVVVELVLVESPVIFKLPTIVEEAVEMRPCKVARPAVLMVAVAVVPILRLPPEKRCP